MNINSINKISDTYKYSRNAIKIFMKKNVKTERTLIETSFITKYQL
jgi:hypothetical protein